MKPTKNRFYCYACGKPKMLFRTEVEAQTFLRFNSDGFDDSSDKVPVRSYYCSLCAGWHVTSRPEKLEYRHHKSLDDSELSHVDQLREALLDRIQH